MPLKVITIHLDDCPFCGAAVIGAGFHEDGLRLNDPARKHPNRYYGASVTCPNCGARGPVAKISENASAQQRQAAVETAFQRWNTRE